MAKIVRPRAGREGIGVTGAAPAASAGGFDHVDVPSRGDAPRQRLTRRDFEALKGRSRRFAGSFLCIDIGSGSARLGITASRKYGSAVERNRFKRLVREAFRRNQWPSIDLHVVPRQKAKQAKLIDIETELKQLVHAQRPSA